MVSGGGGECSGQDPQHPSLSDGFSKFKKTDTILRPPPVIPQTLDWSHMSLPGVVQTETSQRRQHKQVGKKRLHEQDPEIKGNCVRDAHATASISCVAATIATHSIHEQLCNEANMT